MLVIHASKIEKPSIYKEQTNNLIHRLKTREVTLDALDFENVFAYGSRLSLRGEQASAYAFLEFRRRQTGWEKRLLHYVRVAVSKNPRLLLNRGILSISRHALLSIVGLGRLQS